MLDDDYDDGLFDGLLLGLLLFDNNDTAGSIVAWIVVLLVVALCVGAIIYYT